MQEVDAIISGPRLKVKRANQHLDELTSAMTPLSPAFYRIKNESSYSLAKGARFKLIYEPEVEIANTFALIMGDVVHNLRSALDHLATGIVRTRVPRTKMSFPMQQERNKLFSDTGSQKLLDALEAALPGARRLFSEEIRPVHGADEELWSFHSLDNDDKHNFLLPSIVISNVKGSWQIASNKYINCGSIIDADKRQTISEAVSPITILEDFTLAAELSFGDGAVFAEKPVVPTLKKIRDLTTATINIFERAMRLA